MDPLLKALVVMLFNLDEFKSELKSFIQENIKVDERSVMMEPIKAIVKEEVEAAVEAALEDIDVSKQVESAVDNIDLTDTVKAILDETIQNGSFEISFRP